MQHFHKVLFVCVAALMLSHALSAADSVSNVAASVKHSGQVIKHGAIASGQLISGAVAAPLVVVGELGKVSGIAGESLMDIAMDKQSLEISDANITAESAPADVMNSQATVYNRPANVNIQRFR